MKHCLHCGRYYEIYNECPGCGSVKFEQVKNNGKLTIEEPPKGGYKINKNDIIISKGIGIVFKILAYIMIAIIAVEFLIIFIGSFFIESTSFNISDSFDLILIASLLIPSPFIVAIFLALGKAFTNNANITNEKVNRLKNKGVLIKNLKYRKNKDYIEVLYETEKGIKIPLKSYNFYGKVDSNNMPKYCDILFDRDDPTNYIIGFNLY